MQEKMESFLMRDVNQVKEEETPGYHQRIRQDSELRSIRKTPQSKNTLNAAWIRARREGEGSLGRRNFMRKGWT